MWLVFLASMQLGKCVHLVMHPSRNPTKALSMKSIKSQFLDDLGNAYDAEYRIAKALPQMVKPDTSAELKQAILSHAKETMRHVILLEQIFEWFGQPVERKLDIAAAAVADEFGSLLARDPDLLSALKMLEQGSPPPDETPSEWQVASYSCLHEWANLLGNAEGADFLEQVLAEDKAAKRNDAELVRRR